MFVFSPSNMSTFIQCPRKFQAQSITKEIEWKATKQKSRGTYVHNCIEKAIHEGLDAVSSWPEGLDVPFVQRSVDAVLTLKNGGADVFTEKELVVNTKWEPTGWWDDDAYLRAKADALIVSEESGSAALLDFKTGKVYDRDCFQLRVEALLTHFVYHVPVVHYSYWYVDSGERVSGVCDFSQNYGQIQDILDLMQTMRDCINANSFYAKKNRFCKWCQLYKTPECGV